MLSFGVSAYAQPVDWKQVADTGPPVRELHRMAFDKSRGVIVLFGGWTGYGGELGDTWEWNGATWTQRFPATLPGKRLGHAMAYDSRRRVVVMFAGQPETGGMPNDTWEWDGTNWTEIFPATSPERRYGHAMVYDKKRRKVVLYGGFNGGQSLNDTWLWDGVDWVQRFPQTDPGVRQDHAMAYDSARGITILFGGMIYDGATWVYDTSTWEWDGKDWTRIDAPGPPGRKRLAMAYDSLRKVVVLFGGEIGSDKKSDTWEWDGKNWTEINDQGPPARHRHAMAYDSKRRKVVLFAGRGAGPYRQDTWVYAPAYDLRAKFKSTSTNSVKIGRFVRLTARVKNVGERASLPTTVFFYLSLDRKLSQDDVLLGGEAIPALTPGTGTRATHRFRIPASILAGDYYVIVEVIASDANPRNNVRASQATINVFD